MPSDEWGPWVVHDGGPRPVPDGTFCQREYVDRRTGAIIALVTGYVGIGRPGHVDAVAGVRVRVQNTGGRVWLKSERPPLAYVARYRIRRPKAVSILEGILASVTDKETADAHSR